jgi:ferredoxin
MANDAPPHDRSVALRRLVADWRDEREGQALFEGLLALERNARRRRVLARLASAEARHATMLERAVRSEGASLPAFRPSVRARMLLAWARVFGPVSVLPRIASMEDADADRYLRQLDRGEGPTTERATRQAEERANADALAEFARVESGEAAKAVILRIRRFLLVLVGASLFAVSLALARNAQIEGLVFGLLGGILVGPVVHYALAKLAVPLVAGRVWCGWACWTAAVLDQLPFPRGAGWRSTRLRRLRSWHLVVIVLVVSALVLGLGYDRGAVGRDAAWWFLAGNVAYWTLGIVLALALRDNRAFCKYACPVATILRATSRPSLLKIEGDPAACADCASRACATVCPMGVDVPAIVLAGERVGGGECIACQQCMAVCPPNTLAPSWRFDVTRADRLVERPR